MGLLHNMVGLKIARANATHTSFFGGKNVLNALVKLAHKNINNNW